VLKAAGGVDTIRGFATNVSNYTHLYNRDGAAMESSDPCYNELVYVKKLAVSLADHGIRNKGFIIDTARNGKGQIRKVWGNWCNIKGAGLGERPRRRRTVRGCLFSGSRCPESRMAHPTHHSLASIRTVHPLKRHRGAAGRHVVPVLLP